jgi:hypothetical protein
MSIEVGQIRCTERLFDLNHFSGRFFLVTKIRTNMFDDRMLMCDIMYLDDQSSNTYSDSSIEKFSSLINDAPQGESKCQERKKANNNRKNKKQKM